jgi:hypothetical protein
MCAAGSMAISRPRRGRTGRRGGVSPFGHAHAVLCDDLDVPPKTMESPPKSAGSGSVEFGRLPAAPIPVCDEDPPVGQQGGGVA